MLLTLLNTTAALSVSICAMLEKGRMAQDSLVNHLLGAAYKASCDLTLPTRSQVSQTTSAERSLPTSWPSLHPLGSCLFPVTPKLVFNRLGNGWYFSHASSSCFCRPQITTFAPGQAEHPAQSTAPSALPTDSQSPRVEWLTPWDRAPATAHSLPNLIPHQASCWVPVPT